MPAAVSLTLTVVAFALPTFSVASPISGFFLPTVAYQRIVSRPSLGALNFTVNPEALAVLAVVAPLPVTRDVCP